MRTLLAAFLCCLLIGCSKPMAPSDKVQVAAMGATAAAFADDGSRVIIGSVHHGISLWRTADGERLFDWSHRPGQDTLMVAADFSANGKWAVTADLQTLALWDTHTGAGLRFWQAPGEITSLQLDAEGNLALLGLSDNTAVLFDVRKGGIVHSLHHSDRVTSVAISDDGNTAVSGSADSTTIAWDLRSGTVRQKLRLADEVQLVALSADGTLALSMSKYDKALVWSTDGGNILGEVPLAAERLKRGLRLTAARFSHDNQWLLTGRTGSRVTLWQMDGWVAKAEWNIARKSSWKPTATTVLDIAFSTTEGEYLVAASDGNIYRLQL